MKDRYVRYRGAIGAILFLAVLAVAIVTSYHVAAGVTAKPVCTNGTDKERYRCWDSNTSRLLEEGRIADALELLQVFLKQSPDFVQTCHSFAHDVGSTAADILENGSKVEFSANMQVCDYGFYHGLVTALLSRSNNAAEIGMFCANMQAEENDGMKSYSRNACFHGIGHGSITRHEPEEWDDALAVVRQSISICRRAALNDNDFVKCAAGAYNGMAYGSYAERLDPKDPLKICRQLDSTEVPDECYANMASVVFNLTQHKNLQEAIVLAHSVADPKYFSRMVSVFANMYARQVDTGKDAARTCLALDPEMKRHCLSGYVIGLVQAAVPDAKANGAYAFCSVEFLPEQERAGCFRATQEELKSFWSEERVEAACTIVPARFIATCQGVLPTVRTSHAWSIVDRL